MVLRNPRPRYYRQGVVINYNRPNIVQDAGFAIFLHMNKVPTAGCISLDDWAVVDYIRKSTPATGSSWGPTGPCSGSFPVLCVPLAAPNPRRFEKPRPGIRRAWVLSLPCAA